LFGVIQSLHAKASNNKYTLVHIRELYHLKLFLNNFVWNYTEKKHQIKNNDNIKIKEQNQTVTNKEQE